MPRLHLSLRGYWPLITALGRENHCLLRTWPMLGFLHANGWPHIYEHMVSTNWTWCSIKLKTEKDMKLRWGHVGGTWEQWEEELEWGLKWHFIAPVDGSLHNMKLIKNRIEGFPPKFCLLHEKVVKIMLKHQMLTWLELIVLKNYRYHWRSNKQNKPIAFLFWIITC